jgi:hypothetical protein
MPKGLQQNKAKIGEDPVGETQRQPPSRMQPERVEKMSCTLTRKALPVTQLGLRCTVRQAVALVIHKS